MGDVVERIETWSKEGIEPMNVYRCWRRFCRDEQATTAVEYAVMLALIIGVIILAIGNFGVAGNSMFGRIDTQMRAHGIN
jgi:Flp pilus assembly pilin Flp